MTRTEHLFVKLAEECCEVGQRVSKILRFGLAETQPGRTDDNLSRLNAELIDLFAVLEALADAGVDVPAPCDGRLDLSPRLERIEEYLDYSRKQGTLEGP